MKLVSRIAALIVTTALTGCGAGGLASALGGNGSCSPTSFTMNFPTASGYTSSAQINSSTGCFSTAQVTAGAGPLALGFAPFANTAPRSSTLLYLQYSFTTTEFTSGFPSVSITAPAAVIVPGRAFFLAYNNNGFSFGWQAAIEGPASVSGTTISFPGGGGGNIALSAGSNFELALYAVGP